MLFLIAAICNQTCLNGGECLSPGNCTCRKGYIGPSCELDLDECASNLHRCHKNSVCVNMPGWYYCRCKPGYRSILHDNNHGPTCQGEFTKTSCKKTSALNAWISAYNSLLVGRKFVTPFNTFSIP
jgi:hypothetical protein